LIKKTKAKQSRAEQKLQKPGKPKETHKIIRNKTKTARQSRAEQTSQKPEEKKRGNAHRFNKQQKQQAEQSRAEQSRAEQKLQKPGKPMETHTHIF
jgi:hypothetical protein